MIYKPEIAVQWFAEFGIYAVPEYRFHPKRKWRFDFALGTFPRDEGSIRHSRLALEVQGGLFIPGGGRHSRGPALLKEHEKLNAAASLGWRILYTTPDKLCWPETVEMVKEALEV